MDQTLDNTPHLYQVNVVILEARHLAIQSANTKVNISIGKRKKTIHARTNKTDSPYFNDFCVFPFRLPLSILLDEVLTIRVYEKSIKRKLVGSFNVDLATVWSQPNHQFYRKWAVLLNPQNISVGVRGFLKCDIAILAKGVVVKPPSDDEGDDLLEHNLLVPKGAVSDRQRTRVIFTVFRADSFSNFTDTGKIKLYQPYIRITYGGIVGRTSKAKNWKFPIWNEELAFLDLFPPLTQNIFVELYDRRRRSLANTNIEIRTLYEDGVNGFLPTFGPNFVYLYHPFKKFERHRNGATQQSSFTYMARVLLALRTESIEYNSDIRRRKKYKIIPKRISPLVEMNYFVYKKFILFVAIFDVLIFDNNFPGKFVNIRVRLGPKQTTKDPPQKKSKKKEIPDQPALDENPDLPKHIKVNNDCNTTPKQTSSLLNDYCVISFSGKFPCVSVFGEWPDLLSRTYRANIIKNAIRNCTKEINEIKDDLEFETKKRSTFSQKLKKTLVNLSKSCDDILLLTNVINKEDTNLVRNRRLVYHREIADIARKAKIASKQEALNAEVELKKISNYLSRLDKYAQDPENSFPDIEVWLLRHNQTLAQQRIKTEDVVFSENFKSRGMMSGKMQSLLFRGKKGNLKAKMDIFAWFGLADQFDQCLKLLPDGFSKNHQFCRSENGLNIPSLLICNEKHDFQLRAHIFQGKILYGFDSTGLADPYVRVIILNKTKKTQTRKTTLNPVWDETLVFPTITLYGPSSYIKQNQNSITVELFDSETARKSELIGRCFVKPLIKLKDETYRPPKLKWESIISESNEVGKVLITTELLETSGNLNDIFPEGPAPLKIPDNIRPHNVKYRLEVFFWGVRPVTAKKMLKNKVFVLMECGENLLKSPILHNVKHKLNFTGSVKFVEFELPEEPEFAPPCSLKLYHIESAFRHKTFAGTCLIPSVRFFLLYFMSSEETEKEKKIHWYLTRFHEKKKQEKEERRKRRKKEITRNLKSRDFWDTVLFPIVKCYRYCRCKLFKKCQASAYELASTNEDETMSWWVRFYSAEEDSGDTPGRLKIYREELEAQPEFDKFQDLLRTFDMVTGHKKRGSVVRAKVKAAIALYKWPPETKEIKILNKLKEDEGVLSHLILNDPVKVLVRAYIICAINLAGKDLNGSSDPYLHVEFGSHRINDRKFYKPKQRNPTFGKCYELHGTFPHDYLLRIKVIDYDSHSNDDLIGETSIDIENRFYSKHHATCGIPQIFDGKDYNFWRDIHYPTEILEELCRASNLKAPIYRKNSVVIEDQVFETGVLDETEKREENQALAVLHRWQEIPFQGFHLVPEHVETRSLYHPAIPGIEQGKLQLWVDIFPANFRFIPPKVDITPQPPVAMELRAIVWNVVDVVLDERNLLVNGKVSDIYVKGWILTLEEETQKTDIHYKSLNGEGNFNWRFIFQFNYIPVERKIVVKKSLGPFDRYPEERKFHCKLEIQVWDNDTFGDDYLGTLILELCSMPRGAKLPNRCTLKMLKPNAGRINLFKIKKTRGWWPFRRLKMKGTVDSEFEQTGKIDLELEILTAAEAKQFPAGQGRNEPNPLPFPNRPDTSFNWFMNPIKTFRYIIWQRLKKGLIIAFILVILIFFLLIAIYSFPNYFVKKILGA